MSTHLSQIYLWAAKNQAVELENKFNTNNWILCLLNKQIQKKRSFSDPKYVSVN